MSYVAQTDLKGLVPDEYLVGATDDEQSGAVDATVFAAIATAVDEDINGRLAAAYATPLSPVPDLVKAAAKVLVAYLLYARRGVADERNPWAEQAKYWRGKLDSIGKGEQALTHDQDKANAPAVLISEPARTHSAGGNLMV